MLVETFIKDQVMEPEHKSVRIFEFFKIMFDSHNRILLWFRKVRYDLYSLKYLKLVF